MITILVTLLFIFTLSVFLLCIFFLIKFKDEVHTVNIPSLNISHPYQESNQMNQDVLYQRLKESISLKCPEVKMVFEELQCEDALILHFKGISRNTENVLYVLRNYEARDIFLSALEEFVEESKTPKYGMVIAFPFTNNNQNILDTIKSSNLSIQYIFTDESSLTSFPHLDGMNAMLGIGRKPYVRFEVKNDNFNYDWLGELKSQMFEPVYTETALETIKNIRKQLPTDIRMMSYFYPLFSKTIMNEVICLYPELASLFYPVLDKRGNQLVVYAPNEESLNESIEVLNKSVENKKVSIQQIGCNINEHIFDVESEDYSILVHMIQNILKVDRILPVYTENDNDYSLDVPVVSFSPIYQNTLISSLQAKRFYIQLFEMRQKSQK